MSETREVRAARYRARIDANGITARESRNEGKPIDQLYRALIDGPTPELMASTQALMDTLVLDID